MKLLFTAILLLQSLAGIAQKAELTALLKKYSVPGIQLIYTSGATAKTYNLGLCKSNTAQPVTVNSIFQAA